MAITIHVGVIIDIVGWLVVTAFAAVLLMLRHFGESRVFTWADAIVLTAASSTLLATLMGWLHFHILW